MILQMALNRIDYMWVGQNTNCYCGTVDAIFGPKTNSAIIGFQQWVGLYADGVAGDNTWYQIAANCV
ncbi:MAG: peptidoglycan-binding protein [Clostridiales bacterium]|nr:peptidoglycan-binding protein [Clostridiales bacterium]